MFYLILAIISSAMVSVIMRFSEGKAHNRIALLVINYAMCTLLGIGFTGLGRLFVPSEPGFGRTLAMGCFNGALYLISFVLLQYNIHRSGVVLSSTFMKLGLLVTMAVSVCFYGEIPAPAQAVGFVLAVGAILLINAPGSKEAGSFRPGLFWLLLCGGMADAMSKIFEQSGVPGMEPQFLLYTFLTAMLACIGLMLCRKQRIGKWELIYGALIGIPNYLSTKFLLRALEDIPAVIVYPVYAVAGILAVTGAGVLLFREKLEKRQWLALGIILAALILLNI